MKKRVYGTPIEKFWKYVEISTDPDNCWKWNGTVSRKGYGIMRYGEKPNRKITGAHRFSWEIEHNQKVPAGLLVCHTCDNPPCCNPRHLFLGTAKMNTEDMCRKGRDWQPPPMIGENNPVAKLTDKLVIEILRLHSAGLSNMKIARLFGVAKSNITGITNRKHWKHVEYKEAP